MTDRAGRESRWERLWGYAIQGFIHIGVAAYLTNTFFAPESRQELIWHIAGVMVVLLLSGAVFVPVAQRATPGRALRDATCRDRDFRTFDLADAPRQGEPKVNVRSAGPGHGQAYVRPPQGDGGTDGT